MNNKNNPSKRTKYINGLFSRVLISIVLLLGSVIFVKYNNKNLLLYKEYVFEKSFKFAKFNKLYNKYLGSILPFEKVNDKSNTVFNESFKYSEKCKNLDGTKFKVDNNYLMPSLHSGIVVFIGEKENYGNTVIIQGTNGVDIWYTNVNTSLKLYDYVKKNELVGEVKGDSVTLVLQKDNKYIDYSDYEKENKD